MSAKKSSFISGRVWLAKALVFDTTWETVELFRQHWTAEKNNLPLSANVVATINKYLETVPLAQVSRTYRMCSEGI